MSDLPYCKHRDREKRSYRSYARANKARIKAANNPSIPKLRVYHCPQCGYYHLTKMEQR